MEVKEIYQHRSKDIDSEIYKLENNRLIVKHSKSQTEKLNIDEWEEVNYIPDDYQLIERDLSREEKKAIKRFINEKPGFHSNKSLPGKLIAKIKNVFN